MKNSQFAKLLLVIAPLLFAPVTAWSDEVDHPRDGQRRADQELMRLNNVCRAAYGRARIRLLKRSGPIVLSMGDQLILLDGESRQSATVIPPLFHQLKAVSHVPLALFSVLDVAANRRLSKEERDDLLSVSATARQVLPLLCHCDYSQDQLERQITLLRESLEFLNRTLTRDQVDAKEVTAFARGVSERLLQNAEDAARLKIDAYDRQLKQWWATFSKAEREQLVFVVVGASTPRTGNLAIQFFARVIGVEGEGPRVIYAESLFDAEQALNLAGTHLIDERVAQGFFDEPRRMHRDLFADFTTRYLRDLKPYEP